MRNGQDSGAMPAGWPRVFLAPWLGIVRPAKAAAILAAAPPRRFWTMYFAYAAVLAAIVVLLAILDSTVRATWVPPTSLPATSAASALGGWAREINTRTLAEVWRDWHRPGPIGPAEEIFTLVSLIVGAGTAFLAWLYLPLIHRIGALRPAAARSFRAVATAGGLLVVLTVVIGALIVEANWVGGLSARGAPFVLAAAVALGAPSGVSFVLERIGRVVSAIGEVPYPLDLPPTCEGCGYDLSHQPADARCPECGDSIGTSLDPARRPGSKWERPYHRDVRTCVETTWSVVTEPRVFYSGLKLRTGSAAAAAFARRTYICAAIIASVWTLLLLVLGGAPGPWQEVVLVSPAIGLCVALGCWLGHRLGGAIVSTWWMYRDALPDTRWAAKVLAYESAFLWVFGAFWGGFATSIVAAGPWLTKWLGKDFFYKVFGAPAETVALPAGTALLALVWLWRYRIALRAIRWSNF